MVVVEVMSGRGRRRVVMIGLAGSVDADRDVDAARRSCSLEGSRSTRRMDNGGRGGTRCTCTCPGGRNGGGRGHRLTHGGSLTRGGQGRVGTNHIEANTQRRVMIGRRCSRQLIRLMVGDRALGRQVRGLLLNMVAAAAVVVATMQVMVRLLLRRVMLLLVLVLLLLLLLVLVMMLLVVLSLVLVAVIRL